MSLTKSRRDKFLSSWKAKYPDTPPPDVPFLNENLRQEDIEKCIEDTCAAMADLRKMLNQQEFIVTYMKTLLKETNNNASGLDDMIPIITDEEGDFGGRKLYKYMNDAEVSQSQYYSSVPGADVNSAVEAANDHTRFIETDLDDITYMNNIDPKTNNSVGKSSFKQLIDRSSPIPSSDHSGDSPSINRRSKPPVPIPRPSVSDSSPSSSFRKTHRDGMINLSEEQSSNGPNIDTVITIDKSTSSKNISAPESPGPVMKTFGNGSSRNNSIRSNFGSQKSSHLWQTKGMTDEEKMKILNQDNAKLARSLSQEDTISLKDDDADEVSSDEGEEPIYYNMMKLQEQASKRMSCINSPYASVTLLKKQVEDDAHNLYKRFSVHMSNQQPREPSKGGTSTMTVGRYAGSRLAPVIKDMGESSTDSDVFSTPKLTGSSKRGKPPAVAKKPTPPVLHARSVKQPPHVPTRPAPTPPADPVKHVHSQEETPSASQKQEADWKKRRSMQIATAGQVPSFDSATDIEPLEVRTRIDLEQLQMRKWVVTSILDSEKSYIAVLDTLVQYQRIFVAATQTSKPVIPLEDIDVIFFKIEDLVNIHADFIHKLEPLVEKWGPEQEVAAVFDMLARKEYPVAEEYLSNYQKATATIEKCTKENEQFAELTMAIKVKGMSDAATLTELMHKPVVRIQRNTLVLHDLIRCTNTSHPDYDTLQKTLNFSQSFLEKQSPIQTQQGERYMVRNCLVVEKVGSNRKLRHVFLFNDVLVCTKQKMSGKRLHFEVKWCISMFDLNVDSRAYISEEKAMEENSRNDIRQLQQKVSNIQNDLRREISHCKAAHENHPQGRTWSMRSSNRSVEKLKKKLIEHEAQLIIQSPHLILRMRGGRQKKNYTLLMSSDYERNDWRETIKGLKLKVNKLSGVTVLDLQNLVNSIEADKLETIGAVLEKQDLGLDEEYLFGALNVTIHKLNGLSKPADTFCCMEVDSYSHFYMKAKTNIIHRSQEPLWNANFEIDLDAAQTIRFLCYTMDGEEGETLIGKCALELSKAWLRGDFQEKTISLKDGLSITVSVCYVSRDQTIKRTLSSAKTGLFGVRLQSVAKREGTWVPIIVTTCVNEVERRGLEDLGIYRVSGVSSEIQRLKKAFEKNSKGAVPLLREADINCVTGVLKLYLRELPEALFTHVLYPKFNEGMNLSDPESKERYMLALFKNLPEPNQTVARFLISHLVKVSCYEDKNKMSLNNLATVFGPTLLRPAATEQPQNAMELFSMGAREAMVQTSILFFFMELHSQGIDLM